MNVCNICGGEFKGRDVRAAYCSDECRRERMREKWRRKWHKRNPKSPRSESLIYFVQAGEGGPIKIGYSVAPEERVKDFQCGNPWKLRLLRAFPGGVEEERELHARFAADRMHGEWFKPTPELVRLAEDAPQLRLVA